jgi:hypothetical protein
MVKIDVKKSKGQIFGVTHKDKCSDRRRLSATVQCHRDHINGHSSCKLEQYGAKGSQFTNESLWQINA